MVLDALTDLFLDQAGGAPGDDGTIDAAKAADDRGGKADDAKIKPDTEIDFVVVEAVHHAGECRKPRTDGKGDEHDRCKVDAHRARGFLVLRNSPDGETELSP